MDVTKNSIIGIYGIFLKPENPMLEPLFIKVWAIEPDNDIWKSISMARPTEFFLAFQGPTENQTIFP